MRPQRKDIADATRVSCTVSIVVVVIIDVSLIRVGSSAVIVNATSDDVALQSRVRN